MNNIPQSETQTALIQLLNFSLAWKVYYLNLGVGTKLQEEHLPGTTGSAICCILLSSLAWPNLCISSACAASHGLCTAQLHPCTSLLVGLRFLHILAVQLLPTWDCWSCHVALHVPWSLSAPKTALRPVQICTAPPCPSSELWPFSLSAVLFPTLAASPILPHSSTRCIQAHTLCAARISAHSMLPMDVVIGLEGKCVVWRRHDRHLFLPHLFISFLSFF